MKSMFPLVFALAVTSLPAADFRTNQLASVVLGQTNFATDDSNIGPTGLSEPEGVAVDPTTGKVFVADSDNQRVLRYASVAALTSGAAAEIALGQPNLTAVVTPGASSTTMLAPTGLAFDSAGRLYVADSAYNRVLRFDAPSAATTSGVPANGVLGQPNFTTTTATVAVTGMNSPTGLAVQPVGANGLLWVADTGNNRVLMFPGAAGLSAPASATKVLGQINFASSNTPTPPTADSLNSPEGVAVSSDGFLWVADTDNHRMLLFINANTTVGNGFDADFVLGQPNFTTDTVPVSATAVNLYRPASVALDESGPFHTLWVADRVHNRLLRFLNTNTTDLVNGGAAETVLGQASLTGDSASTTQRGLSFPHGLTVDGFNTGSPAALLVSDFGNNRVLRFDPQNPAPPTVVFSRIPPTKKKKVPLGVFPASEAGIASVTYKGKKGGFKSAGGSGFLWFVPAKLEVGKNKFTVIVTDTLGQSTTRTVVITRKKK